MVPMAALVNWNYRPRWGFEGYCGKKMLNQQIAPESPIFQGITWGRLILALISVPLSGYVLPLFLKTTAAKYIFGIIFVVSIFIATLNMGISSWITYLLIIAYLYPLIAVHFKQDPIYSQMKLIIENITEAPPPYPGK